MNPYRQNDDFVLIAQETAKANFLKLAENNVFLKKFYKSFQDDLLVVNKELGLSDNFSIKDIKEINFLISKYKINDSYHEEAISKIMEDVGKIKDSLYPLSEILGLKFEISVVGGAIRDLLLGKSKEIKDLDILISIDESQFKKYNPDNEIVKKMSRDGWDEVTIQRVIPNDEKFEIIIDSYLKDNEHKYKELKIKDFIYNPNAGTKKIEQFFYHLLKESIIGNFNIEKEYPPKPMSLNNEDIDKIRNIEQEDYLNMLLRGVIKLLDKNLNYKIDLLLSNINTAKYVESFDFNICQAYLPVYSNVYTTHNLNCNNVDDFKDNITCNEVFLEDVLKRTITLNPTGYVSINKMLGSTNGHYPRIKEKYPDYEFGIDKSVLKEKDKNVFDLTKADFNNQLKEDRIDFLLSFVEYMKINNNVKENIIENKEKRNKI